MSDNKKVKPQNPKGTRDFLPQQVAKRNFIFSTIKSVFRQYGFEEIETPALENLETLEGKYGDEGEKLLFKIRSNKNLRNRLSHEKVVSLDEIYPYFVPDKSEKGLRYDLTVPLARYVVQHQDEIVFPFRRFHIGPVWRGDKPQKGRYQEFYQCDADIIGTNSLIADIELTMIYLDVFRLLGIDVTVQINNRKILKGIAKHFQVDSRFAEFVIIMDKLDKIGWKGVADELIKSNLRLKNGASELEERLYSLDLSEFRENIWQNTRSWNELKECLHGIFSRYGGHGYDNETVLGINEIVNVGNHFDYNTKLQFNPYLARGLDYYTGTIWEVAANGVDMGSIASGGRYDNLTEMFGGQGMSGVGISFGIERIYDVMEELNLFPENIAQGVKILFVPRDASNEEYAFKLATIARAEGISAEVFLGKAKKNKHFGYAATKGINYMVEVGDNEQQSRHFRLRNVAEHKEEGTGFSLEELMQHLKQ